jgi:hypothetical protein
VREEDTTNVPFSILLQNLDEELEVAVKQGKNKVKLSS